MSLVNDGLQTSETTTITAHGTTELTVVYTNETWKVDETLAMYEKWLDEEKDRFVGLDLEYTPRGRDQRIAVVQLAMRQHVLVYHYCRGSKHCPPELAEFLQRKQITFVSVDITGDTEMLRRAAIHIPAEYHVDLQVMFKIKARGEKAGMGYLAAAIIDPSYLDMKDKCTNDMHQKWHWKPLSQKHLEYAAKDGYVSYEMYRRILSMKEGLGLGKPVWNDKLCVRCKSGDNYKRYKRLKTGWQQGQNRWEQGDDEGASAQNTWDQGDDEGLKGKDKWEQGDDDQGQSAQNTWDDNW